MGHRTILLAVDAPAKPAPGAPCNGCGVCCAAEPCPLGALVSRRRQGACAALKWDDAERAYRCGLFASRWLPQAWVRRWIAAGAGCDCTLETARVA